MTVFYLSYATKKIVVSDFCFINVYTSFIDNYFVTLLPYFKDV